MSVVIADDNSSVRRAASLLSHFPREFPKAVARAANRTLEGLRTRAARETAARYFARIGDIKRTITLRKMGGANLSAAMISKGPRKSLADYKLTGRRAGTLKGAVKRAGGLKPLGPAFLINRSGKNHPYVRVDRGRWGISRLISPAVPQILKNEETIAALSEWAEGYFSSRLDHETARILGVVR